MAFGGGDGTFVPPPLKGPKKKFWGLGVGIFFFCAPLETVCLSYPRPVSPSAATLSLLG